MTAAHPIASLCAATVMVGASGVWAAGLWAAEDGPQIVPGDGVMIPVPSGQDVTLQDVVWNVPGPDGLTLRFRFVAPAIAGGMGFETAAADMQFLCDSYALPRVAEFGPQPAQIVISLSAAPLPFGEAAPDVVQFFESYSLADGACQWELF